MTLTLAGSSCAAVWGFDDPVPATLESSERDASTTTTPLPDSRDAGAVIGNTGPDGGPATNPWSDAAEGSDAGSSVVVGVDANVTPPVCVPAVADDAKGVFVALAGADGFSCGARTSPCRTVQFGLDRARDTAKENVYVGGGTFTESITLRSGIAVSGGWGVESTRWSKDCVAAGRATTVLASPAGAAATVTAANLVAPASLIEMTVRSAPTNTLGQSASVYGIRATGSTTELHLVDVDVLVAAAADGPDGASGGAGMPGGSSCPASDGASGPPVPGSAPATTAGAFSSTGYMSTWGPPGSPGLPGNAGSFTPGACASCVSCTGPALRCGSVPAPSACGGAGASGCGGGAGAGGNGGGGGGSSVALFAWDARVTVTNGVLRSGNGGNGGAGGQGGPGGPGGVGAHGAKSNECATSCGIVVINWKCGTTSSNSGQGGAGSRGGTGSTGTTGGGGSGGSSFAAFEGGSAKITVTNAVLASGLAGTSRGNGPVGRAGDIGR